ncbi:hypothetical protein UlMin_031555 [Ulmus minor]
MASPTSIQFIEFALSSSSPFVLSYTDPDQKWQIRKDLLSLLQDYPTFTPSFDTFVHNNGLAVHLLFVSGNLHVSRTTPLVPLVIWLHENHPFMAPMVFVSSNTVNPIHPNHPFVNPWGGITCPYIQTWAYPRSNLSNLVRNLVKLFSHDHPLMALSPASSFAHPSLISKMEALDRLAGTIHYDIKVMNAEAENDIEELSKLQAKTAERVDFVEGLICGLDQEKRNLKGRVMKLTDDADVLMNWLRFNGREAVNSTMEDEIEDAFEMEGDSKLVLECLAGEKAIDDVIYALDKAVEGGVVGFESYIKQVRTLAREQFYHRAMLVKLRGSNILNWHG